VPCQLSLVCLGVLMLLTADLFKTIAEVGEFIAEVWTVVRDLLKRVIEIGWLRIDLGREILSTED